MGSKLTGKARRREVEKVNKLTGRTSYSKDRQEETEQSGESKEEREKKLLAGNTGEEEKEKGKNVENKLTGKTSMEREGEREGEEIYRRPEKDGSLSLFGMRTVTNMTRSTTQLGDLTRLTTQLVCAVIKRRHVVTIHNGRHVVDA